MVRDLHVVEAVDPEYLLDHIGFTGNVGPVCRHNRYETIIRRLRFNVQVLQNVVDSFPVDRLTDQPVNMCVFYRNPEGGNFLRIDIVDVRSYFTSGQFPDQ